MDLTAYSNFMMIHFIHAYELRLENPHFANVDLLLPPSCKTPIEVKGRFVVVGL